MVENVTAILCFLTVLAAEGLHHRRCRRVWLLAFADGRPSLWVRVSPVVRAAACALMCWGLLVLLRAPAADGDSEQGMALRKTDISTCRHVVVILDVSPSMRIRDAGATGVQKRSRRAIDVMDSVLERVARQDVRYSLVAVYTDARPVIVGSIDTGVLKNIMEFPLEQAFDHGKTRLIKGVEVAFDIARDWAPGSTTFIMLTDGDTSDIGAGGFPRPPKSLARFVIAGLGTRRGAFIDGHQSRQDTATLRFMASRFKGVYEDTNARHLPTHAIGALVGGDRDDPGTPWTRERLALAACGTGALLLALIPILLEIFGFNMAKHLAEKRRLTAKVGA
ncbi:MAG: vWA domain-containing protein [Lentisphaeria bacterium]|nr:vWA domain-containing protein [Lentisphaeria bacterium]